MPSRCSAAPEAGERPARNLAARTFIPTISAMSVRLYSTLTGREEDVAPLHPDGVLRMYVCGMTPKFHPHLGHGRVFVAMDVMRRYLLYRGYQLKYVQNFTDVDDKIIQRAANERRDTHSTAQAYMDSYFDVMDQLHVQRADLYPTVTEYMERIVEFIAGLVESNHAYPSDMGDVWFDVGSFPAYGKLSKRDLNSQLVAARKELEVGKRDPRDFALWKRAREDEPSWPSPWGPGRPGWHIECSAMVRETLGNQIDIHGGGADLIFPHHENEIAQSESLTGQEPLVRHWTHAGLVVLGGGAEAGAKMAHSAENFTTLRHILNRYDALDVRYYLLATHYRTPLTFALETDASGVGHVRGIEDAHGAVGRLRRAVGPEPLDPHGTLDNSAVARFVAAMDADINTPDALAAVFDLAREVNTLRANSAPADQRDRGRRTLVHLLAILGLDLGPSSSAGAEAHVSSEAFVDLLLEVRQKLRTAKQWQLADEVRDRLKTLGVVVEDTPTGESTWRLER
ncbi:MAG: cysteine--tRNA ligase [Chloroflexota bacterium]